MNTRPAIENMPDVPEMVRQAAEAFRHDRTAEAEKLCGAILRIAPENFDARYMLGTLRNRQREFVSARILLKSALRTNPDDGQALVQYAGVLESLGHPVEAQATYEKALAGYDAALAAGQGEYKIYVRRGKALRNLGRAEEALASFEAAIACKPESVSAISYRADTLRELNRPREALASYYEALRIDPGYAPAHHRAGQVHLGLGELEEGWEQHEWRWKQMEFVEAHKLMRHRLDIPPWDGKRVNGTLLVWAEQGMGEEILYASMVPELVERARSVVLEVSSRLVDLFARSIPGIRIVPIGSALDVSQIDAQISLGSLGRYLRTKRESFPVRSSGYLKPDPSRAALLRKRFEGDPRKVVGLCWRSQGTTFGRFKTANLSSFLPLLQHADYRFISVQYGDTATECEAIKRDYGVTVERIADVDNTKDIDGLAALMTACDAVLSVSNTNVHIAAGLGLPTWVLVPKGRGKLWFWFYEGDYSPWYSRLRVCRQKMDETWEETVARVTPEIAAFLSSVEPRGKTGP